MRSAIECGLATEVGPDQEAGISNGITSERGQTIGLDLGDRFTEGRILDAGGEVIEAFRVRTTEPAPRARLGRVDPSLVRPIVHRGEQAQHGSGEQCPQLRITKAGARLLRRLLVRCAHYIVVPFGAETDLRRAGLRMAERGGKAAKKRAIVAIARRLAVLLHRLWITGEEYEPLRSETSKAA